MRAIIASVNPEADILLSTLLYRTTSEKDVNHTRDDRYFGL